MYGRAAYLFLAFLCHELLVAALYFQYVEGLNPCPLCMVQRYAVGAMGVVLLLLALFNPKPAGGFSRSLHGVGVLGALLGIAAAGRQVWLQSLPPADVPACGPSLDYMLEALPAGEILTELLKGSGDCAKVDWAFLGLSMGAWMLIVFGVALAYFLFRVLKRS